MIKQGDSYKPSNGDEGINFQDYYCENCRHDDAENERYCNIISLTMLYDIEDKEYPKEWIYGENLKPTCTKFEEELTPEEVRQERIKREEAKMLEDGQLTLFD